MKCLDFKDHKCSTCGSDRIVVAQENKRTYRLQNRSGRLICKLRVDACLVTEGKRCDFIIIDCEAEDVFLIELKGNKLIHGLEQLDATFERFRNRFQGRVYARIILSRVSVPNLANEPAMLKLQRKIKQTGGDLRTSTRLFEEIL